MEMYHDTNLNETPNNPQTLFQGRFGWYPRSYGDYIILKRLYKWVFQAYRSHCRYIKYYQKNTCKASELPTIDLKFTLWEEQNYKTFPMIHYLKKDGKKERVRIYKNMYSGDMQYTIQPYIADIIDTFIICKTPKASPEEVMQPPLSSQQLRQLYSKIIPQK